MKNSLLILLALLLVFSSASAQHNGSLSSFRNRFMNPLVAPLHLNPGFAGSLDQQRFAFAWRHQWVAIPGSYKTLYASYDRVSNRLKGAFGGEYYHEAYGEGGNHDIRVSGIYALKLNLGSNWTLSPAVKLGYQHQRIDLFGGVSERSLTRQSLNFSPGILINSPVFYLGLSSEALASLSLEEKAVGVNYTDIRPVPAWKVQSGYRFQPTGKPWSLAASGVVVFSNDYFETLVQLIYQRKWLLAGAGFGNSIRDQQPSNNSFSLTAGYKHPRFRLLGVYDYSISPLTNGISGASYELSLMVYLPS
jgi:type IX secretion system PorP/SprF family membrane protein